MQQLPGAPAGSDAGSILVWVLGLVGVALTGAGILLRMWLTAYLAERAEDRRLALEKRKREELEEAERRKREEDAEVERQKRDREALEEMVQVAKALPIVLTQAIKEVGQQMTVGFEALAKRMAEHEDRIHRIYTEETTSFVRQIHDVLVPPPRSERASSPTLPSVIEPPPQRPLRRPGSRPQ